MRHGAGSGTVVGVEPEVGWACRVEWVINRGSTGFDRGLGTVPDHNRDVFCRADTGTNAEIVAAGISGTVKLYEGIVFADATDCFVGYADVKRCATDFNVGSGESPHGNFAHGDAVTDIAVTGIDDLDRARFGRDAAFKEYLAGSECSIACQASKQAEG